jgi:hypothetical protein
MATTSTTAATTTTTTGSHSKPSESLLEIKDLIKFKLAKGECCSLAECKRFVHAVIAASEAGGLYKLNAVDTHSLRKRLVWRLNP